MSGDTNFSNDVKHTIIKNFKKFLLLIISTKLIINKLRVIFLLITYVTSQVSPETDCFSVEVTLNTFIQHLHSSQALSSGTRLVTMDSTIGYDWKFAY